MPSNDDIIEIQKKRRGRPPISDEEKRIRKRNYERKYQKQRYSSDENFRETKKEKNLNRYHSD